MDRVRLLRAGRPLERGERGRALSLRDAGAELQASAATQLVMTLSKLLFGAFMLLGGVLGE